MSPETFDLHCQAMTRAGYHGVGLEEAAAYLLHGEPLPPKSVLITFDDGYLDNYVYGMPILRQHGHKATVFVVAERIQEQGLHHTLCEERKGYGHVPAAVDRPYEKDPLGNLQRKDVFMSWDEARVAEAAEALDIAAHSRSHAPVWEPPPLNAWQANPGLMEFHRPCPRHRTFDRPQHPVRFGMPVLPEKPGLTSRGFIPSPELLSLAASLVPQNLERAADFFRDPQNLARLRQEYLKLPLERWGRMEEPDEYRQRVHDDLMSCRGIMERNLTLYSRRPLTRSCLAWPWGASTPETEAIARELGFKVFFHTSFGANPPGRPRHVHRFKARDKSASWLLSRLWIYSRPLLARAYAAVRF